MSNMRQKSSVPPLHSGRTLIEFKGMKFLITDRPSDVTMLRYVMELKKHNVKIMVRLCESTYRTDQIEAHGIVVRDLTFQDGTFPPQNIIDEWFEIVKQNYQQNPDGCVAVHCVAGLGRAPVLVAVALIELGLKYEEAVEIIREKRRGAFNAKQLSYLERYKPKGRLRHKNGLKSLCCVQ